MSYKAQYNPSTLKASYDAVTNKAIYYSNEIPSECEWCESVMPKSITIGIYNLIDGWCCGPGGWDFKWVGIDSYLNETRIDIPHSTGCLYHLCIEAEMHFYIKNYPLS